MIERDRPDPKDLLTPVGGVNTLQILSVLKDDTTVKVN